MNPASVPVISFIEFETNDRLPDQIKGRDVIIGITEPGVVTPASVVRFGRIERPLLLAIAAESEILRMQPVLVPLWIQAAIWFVIIVPAGILFGKMKQLSAVCTASAIVIVIAFLCITLQKQESLSLSFAAPLTAVLLTCILTGDSDKIEAGIRRIRSMTGTQPSGHAHPGRDNPTPTAEVSNERLADPLQLTFAKAVDELKTRIAQGESRVAASLLQTYPELAENDTLSIELIYREHLVSRASGNPVLRDEVLAQFPHWKSRLEWILELDSMLDLFSTVDEPAGLEFDPLLCDLNDRLGLCSVPAPRLGAYEIQERVARGGMGIVYRARQTDVDRDVAIKFLIGSELAKSTRARFFNEARTAAQIRHPGIVQIIETGEWHGCIYLVMEF
ncbi:MAG: protein kinase, partial [Planctomycetaceae bacterium]|nr:protein kinase [Planctomycetaceae bacterium]